MYSKLLPIEKETPSRIIREIRRPLVEHFDFGKQIINGSELFDRIASYEEWLEKVVANADAETVAPDWVLTDTFFAVRADDDRIVGIVDLRFLEFTYT